MFMQMFNSAEVEKGYQDHLLSQFKEVREQLAQAKELLNEKDLEIAAKEEELAGALQKVQFVVSDVMMINGQIAICRATLL